MLARVSGTTVSRVLGGRPDESVSEKAKLRVLDAARQLGYSPNPAAKALRSGRSGLVALWMCLEYSRYRGEVLAQVRKILAETDFALSVNDVDEDYVCHHSLTRALRVPAEGIVAFEPSRLGEAFDEADINLPFVSMGAFWIPSKSYVAIDLQSGAEEAMDHLFATGRKSIAYVAPEGLAFIYEEQRYLGYRNKMQSANLKPRTIEIAESPANRIASIQKELSELIESRTMPDALVCFFDDIAADTVEALQLLGLTPGRDVAVVGFNGNEGLDRGPFPITTVRQPVEEMCALAFQFLRNQMEDPSIPIQRAVLKPTLVIRQSTSGSSQGP